MPDLRAELARLPPGEKVRVIIRMKDQLSAEERDKAVAGIGNARDPKSKPFSNTSDNILHKWTNAALSRRRPAAVGLCE